MLEQPQHFAWQIFDSKVFDLLYEEYRFDDASFVEADDLAALVQKLDGEYIPKEKSIFEDNPKLIVLKMLNPWSHGSS